jgi:hypothetical protein
MSVFRVYSRSGSEWVTMATSLEDAKELGDDKATRLTALEVLEEICGDLNDYEDELADELYPAMQQFSDTITDLVRRNPGAFAGDDPAGRLWDAVDAFLSGKWEG